MNTADVRGKGHGALGPGSPWVTVKIPFYVDERKGFYSWGSDKVLFQQPYSASFILSFIFKLSEEESTHFGLIYIKILHTVRNEVLHLNIKE